MNISEIRLFQYNYKSYSFSLSVNNSIILIYNEHNYTSVY